MLEWLIFQHPERFHVYPNGKFRTVEELTVRLGLQTHPKFSLWPSYESENCTAAVSGRYLSNLFLVAICLTIVWTTRAGAQFSTVINVPPDADPGFAGSDTQVNVFEGGLLGNYFDVGLPDGTSTNAELNIDGGIVGSYLDGYAGSEVNLFEGTIGGDFHIWQGSQFNILGGSTGLIYVREGSQILATGGTISQVFTYGGTITVDGGYLGGNSFVGLTGTEESVVNLVDGYISSYFEAGFRAVVNVSGGYIGSSFDATPGSVVNVSGGRIYRHFDSEGEVNLTGGLIDSNFNALAGSTVNISGGRVGYGMEAHGGSQVTLTGGNVGSRFLAQSGSSVRIAGGVYADNMTMKVDSDVTIAGGEFLLDGQPIPGLGGVGDLQALSVPEGSLLSGTLSDGTPFAFTTVDGDTLAGNITLEVTSLPAIGPALIFASTDPVPLGIRTGQTLIVDEGGLTPESFVAGPGSTLAVETGGLVDDYAKAVGAEVNVTGGTIRNGFDVMQGSIMHLTGGEIEHYVDVFDNSLLEVDGGEISGTLRAKPGSTVRVLSGTVRYLEAEGGLAEIGGGLFPRGPHVLSGAQLQIAGGVFQPGMYAADGSSIALQGGEFRIDGQPVEGLVTPGSTVQVDLPEGSVLTGVLEDGTTIALSPLLGDNIAVGALTLSASALPPASPTIIHAPLDPIPAGLRGGQTLILDAGSVVPDRFAAIQGSTIQLNKGGQIGSYLELVGAQLQVNGGVVMGTTNVLEGSRVVVSGGSVGGRLTGAESEFVISGNASVGYFTVGNGSTATIVGGDVSVGGRGYPIDVEENGTLYFAGTARTSGIAAYSGSDVVIAGGEIIFELDAYENSALEIIAAEIFLDGMPLVGLSTGTSVELLEREGILSGQYVNGLEFEFELSTTNVFRQAYFDPLATITLTQVLPYDLNFDGVVNALDLQLWESVFGITSTPPGIGADGNFDSRVDGADFLNWQRNYGATIPPPQPGDFDFDDDVDGADFLTWQHGESPNPLSASDLADWESNYGTTSPAIAAASTTIPEPSTVLLGVMASLFGISFRWYS